jgi:hypothetical protein
MILSSKLRTSIALLAAGASLAVATAPMTPAASARPNIPGRYTKSSEGQRHQRINQESCNNDHDRYKQLVDAGQALLSANQPGSTDAFDAAKHIRDTDQKGGCSWAQ